jgi:hypothetical protein
MNVLEMSRHRIRIYQGIERLIWLYFWLLIFEGALRKWVLPSAANILLIVRDPVVILVYFYAWRVGLFPRNKYILFGALIGALTFFLGLIATGGSLLIVLYGFRAHFLQIPMIFIIAKVLQKKHVDAIGYWILILSAPMALLMAVQFISPANSFINAGSDEKFSQIGSAMGHIRAAGTFSFISGPIFFYPLVAVFISYNQIHKIYSPFVTAMALVGLVVGSAMSGSRSVVVSVAAVFFVAFAFVISQKSQLAVKWLSGLGALVIVFLLARSFPIVQMSLDVFSQRVNEASGSEGGAGGFFARIGESLGGGAYRGLLDSPLIGHGLGVGTNGGAALATGKVGFLLAEVEWERIILESGPFFGMAFILYRLSLCFLLLRVSFGQAVRKDPLPLLILSSCIFNVANGNWGQPTALGFAVFCSGLCLAAAGTSGNRNRAKKSRSTANYRAPISTSTLSGVPS